MENLLAQIDTLSDSDLIEAASYYLASITGAYSTSEVEEQSLRYCEELGIDISALEIVRNDMSRDPESYRPLLRFLLREAAQGSEEQRQQVIESIEGAGLKQIVVDPLTAIVLGTLATMQFIVTMRHLRYSHGKNKEVEKEEIEVRPDGSMHSSKTKETIWAKPSTPFASFLDLLKKSSGGDNQSS